MGVLDELREAVKKRVRLTKCIDELFDAFEAEHPGLIDATQPCDHCGRPMSWQRGIGWHVLDTRPGSLSGNVCPACGGDA